MASDHAIARYRRWYRRLLGLYSKAHRERFAESMEQTFTDCCRERAEAGRPLGTYLFWLFLEAFANIVRENLMSRLDQDRTRRLAAWGVVVAAILVIPLIGTCFGGWSWQPLDFVGAGVVLLSAALVYELVATKGGTVAYRVALGIAVATGLFLAFVNAAAGIIGDGPVNLMYFAVLLLGFVVAVLARFEPRGMAAALVAVALGQFLVPVIALALWRAGWESLMTSSHSPHPPFHPGIVPVFVLNTLFVLLWVVSASLFRRSAITRSLISAPLPHSGAGL